MKRSNSGRLKDDLRNHLEQSQHWSDEVEEQNGKRREETKDFNIVLIHQDKKFFTSELFKVIQDAISLVLHYMTMC